MMETPKMKMGQNARNFRLLNRMDAFQQKRKTFDQLDYLQFYSPEQRQLILSSMQAPIPSPLPELSPASISFYRRSSTPVFCTRLKQSLELEGHMTYQALWMLSSLDQKTFENYPGVVKEFQKDLQLYLSANSNDIREMAITAAGNKIIGKEEDILSIVQRDSKQLWVLANHIYQNKMTYVHLWPFIKQQHQFAFKTLFEFTMLLNQPIQEITSDENTLKLILSCFNADNQNIRKYAMRIIGNTLSLKENLYNLLHQHNILQYLSINLNCSSGQVRRDCCWLISNLCAKKQSTDLVMKHPKTIGRLVQLFGTEVLLMVKKELTFVFSYIAHFGNRKQALTLLGHPNVLEICFNQLTIEDVDLNLATLQFIHELLQLGDNMRYQQGYNGILQMMKQAGPLFNQISNKSYSQNSDISSISLDIINIMEDQDDQ